MVYFFILILFLVSVSFSTLLERKILGFLNYRLGPSKTFYWGLMIPFSDFLKLILKNSFMVSFLNFYYLIPFLGLMVCFFMIYFYPFNQSGFSVFYGIIYIFLLYSVTIYFFFFMSSSSNNFFSYLSAYRVLSQSISYEIGFVFCFIFLLFSWSNFDLLNLLEMNFMFFSNLLFFMVMFMFLLGESGRSPFDFIEGESELVSGFNVEYFGGIFSLIFLVEYGFLIFSSFLMSYMMFGDFSFIFFLLMFYFFSFVRCLFPRLRFDQMMIFFWIYLLIFLIVMMFFMIMFS